MNNEFKRMQKLAGINEIKIETPGSIKNYKQFVNKFNQIFAQYVEPLDIESIYSERDEREDGETYLLSLDKIDQTVTSEQLETIFNTEFSKYGIKLAEIEDVDDHFRFYLEPINFKNINEIKINQPGKDNIPALGILFHPNPEYDGDNDDRLYVWDIDALEKLVKSMGYEDYEEVVSEMTHYTSPGDEDDMRMWRRDNPNLQPEDITVQMYKDSIEQEFEK